MKKIIMISIFSVLLCQISVAQEHTDTVSWQQQVRERLDCLLDNSFFDKTQLGLMIYDLTADSVLYARHEKQTLRPASTMKILTAITALERLGGNYQFRTSLYYDGSIESNVLNGNIYCQGGFDPAFDSRDMDAFIAGIKALGIDTVKGNIYADVSFKDATRYGEGWCWDDVDYMLTPLQYNHDLNDVFMDVFHRRLLSDTICLISDTCAYNLTQTTPSEAVLIATRTHDLPVILGKMMKESDNLYAESVLYQIAHAVKGSGAKAKDGLEQLNKLVSQLGFRASDYRFADGSGLSQYNYVSAELECMFLKYAFKEQSIFEYLYPSLPVAGKDGTLKRRMKQTTAGDNVHAKTGTVTGVSSLAGYLNAPNGHFICFCMINQGIMNVNEAKFFQNRICQILCNQ